MKKSSLSSEAKFTHQAEWPAHGIEKTMALCFRAGCIHPVFFSRPKRKAQEIGGPGNETPAHAHAKKGAFEETRRTEARGGQPLVSLCRETTCCRIPLHGCFHFAGQLHFQQV